MSWYAFFLKLWYAYIVRFAQHLYARTGERGTVPCGHRIKDGIRATDASTGILVHARVDLSAQCYHKSCGESEHRTPTVSHCGL